MRGIQNCFPIWAISSIIFVSSQFLLPSIRKLPLLLLLCSMAEYAVKFELGALYSIEVMIFLVDLHELIHINSWVFIFRGGPLLRKSNARFDKPLNWVRYRVIHRIILSFQLKVWDWAIEIWGIQPFRLCCRLLCGGYSGQHWTVPTILLTDYFWTCIKVLLSIIDYQRISGRWEGCVGDGCFSVAPREDRWESWK